MTRGSLSRKTSADDRDERAVLLAEAWWPTRYVGDLSVAEWERVYAAVDDEERGGGL